MDLDFNKELDEQIGLMGLNLESTQVPKKETSVKETAIEDDEIVFVNLAKSSKLTQTPFLKVKEGECTRITLNSIEQAVLLRMHYIVGLGWVKCHSKYGETGYLEQAEECCKENVNGVLVDRLDDSGKPMFAKQRYLLPVVEYAVDTETGNRLDPSRHPEVRIWNLNSVEMKNLKEQIESIATNSDDLSTADLTKVDFKIKKSKSQGGFLMNTIAICPSSYRADCGSLIEQEFSKVDRELYRIAIKESRKDIPVSVIANAYLQQKLAKETADVIQQNQGNTGYGVNLTGGSV